jgi:hypothetical protein
MTTLVRDSRDLRTLSGENRAALRRPVKLSARLRDRGARPFAIILADLSPTGFRAEVAFTLKLGTLVWITLPGLSGLEAEIAWQRGAQIGGKFRQPLHSAVFEHICEMGR